MAEEKGESMWSLVQVGKGVLVECPSRWYLGVVTERNSVTFTIDEVIVGHDLGDLGMFAAGRISTSTELTPIPRPKEINFASVDTVEEFPIEYIRNMRKRTHKELDEVTDDNS